MEIDELFNLPAHPLLVHVPIVLVPLALLAALIALVPFARRPAALAAAALALVGGVGAFLAVGAGEKLQDRVRETELVEEHAESGEAVELPAIVFAVLAVAGAAAVEVGRRRVVRPVSGGALSDGPGATAATASAARASAGPASAAPASATSATRASATRPRLPAWVPVVVLAASAVVGAYTTYTVVDAGHSGSKSVWSGTTAGGSNRGPGGGADEDSDGAGGGGGDDDDGYDGG